MLICPELFTTIGRSWDSNPATAKCLQLYIQHTLVVFHEEPKKLQVYNKFITMY